MIPAENIVLQERPTIIDVRDLDSVTPPVTDGPLQIVTAQRQRTVRGVVVLPRSYVGSRSGVSTAYWIQTSPDQWWGLGCPGMVVQFLNMFAEVGYNNGRLYVNRTVWDVKAHTDDFADFAAEIANLPNWLAQLVRQQWVARRAADESQLYNMRDEAARLKPYIDRLQPWAYTAWQKTMGLAGGSGAAILRRIMKRCDSVRDCEQWAETFLAAWALSSVPERVLARIERAARGQDIMPQLKRGVVRPPLSIFFQRLPPNFSPPPLKRAARSASEFCGNYPLDGIKYFRPDVQVDIQCPVCLCEHSIDISESGIGYPESQTSLYYECQCGARLVLDLDIRMKSCISVLDVRRS